MQLAFRPPRSDRRLKALAQAIRATVVAEADVGWRLPALRAAAESVRRGGSHLRIYVLVFSVHATHRCALYCTHEGCHVQGRCPSGEPAGGRTPGAPPQSLKCRGAHYHLARGLIV